MPEGDTVFLAGQRMHEALTGKTLRRGELRHPRLSTLELAGLDVLGVVLLATLAWGGEWLDEPAARQDATQAQQESAAPRHDYVEKMKAFSRAQSGERRALQQRMQAAGHDREAIRQALSALREQQRAAMSEYRASLAAEASLP